MRILVIHNYYQFRGGEDECAEQETRLLREHGHEVRFFSRHNDEIRALSPPGMALLPFRAVWSARTFRDLRAACREFRPDVAHVHNWFPLLSPAVFRACRAEGVPTVYTLHDYRLFCPMGCLYKAGRICEDCRSRSLWQGVRDRCYRGNFGATATAALTLAAHRCAGTWRRDVSAYIALTEFSRDWFVGAGLPAERISLRPNFAWDVGRREGLRAGALFVGRLSAEKGISELLDAWRELPDVPLTVMGDGPLRAEAEAKVRAAGLSQVTLTGFRPMDEVVEAMRRALFLLVPSQWYEVCPRTIIEAFAAGTPVLATRVGGLPHMVEDGRTGLVFEPGSPGDIAAKVRRACSDPAALAAWGDEARREYERRYTPEAAHRRLMEIYESLRGAGARVRG